MSELFPTNLSELSIGYIDFETIHQSVDEVSVEAVTSYGVMQITFSKIVTLNISRDIAELDLEGLNVYEINHEYRLPQFSDFKDYQYFANQEDFDRSLSSQKLHIIQIIASILICMICLDLKIEKIRDLDD